MQTEYSLWTRDPEEGVLDALRLLDVGFVAYSPLGRGFLTGQIKKIEDLAQDDFRRQNPRFQGENFKKNLELVARVEEIAKEHKCTPAQLALAWVLAQGDDIVPIPGTRHPERVEENVGALNVVLSESDLRRIDAAAPKGNRRRRALRRRRDEERQSLTGAAPQLWPERLPSATTSIRAATSTRITRAAWTT